MNLAGLRSFYQTMNRVLPSKQSKTQTKIPDLDISMWFAVTKKLPLKCFKMVKKVLAY